MTPSGNTLSATLLGVVPGITVTNRGTSYSVGDPIIISGGGGANASAYVSAISSGTLAGISVIDGASGFQAYPNFTVNVIGSNSPQIAQITYVDTSGSISPNSYIFNTDSLSLNYNTPALSNTGNTKVINTWNTYNYSNCGPIGIITVLEGSGGFTQNPTVEIIQSSPIGNTNTYINQYGTIGTFKIIERGIGYKVGDVIKVTNYTSRGVAGGGIVTSVNANGAILSTYVSLPTIDGLANGSGNTIYGTNTKFTKELFANNNVSYPNTGSYIIFNNNTYRVNNIISDVQLTITGTINPSGNLLPIALQGFPLGGMGYSQNDVESGILCTVSSLTGSNASIMVDSILGSGEILEDIPGTYGQIEAITMSNFGDHYTSQPTVSFPTGDGTATGYADLISAQFQYPGYFLNEDGMLSARRYLESSDTYNNYTYILKSPIAVSAYQSLVKNILHPAGSNMLGIVNFELNESNNNNIIPNTLYINITPPLGGNLLGVSLILGISKLGIFSGIGNILGVTFILGKSRLN